MKKIKKLLKKIPFVAYMLEKKRQLFSKKNNIKKSIKGTGNEILFDKTSGLFNCKFDILGSDNKIIIASECLFNNVTFYIQGNRNVIFISDRVKFYRGGSLWLEGDGCELKIGLQTTFEDVHIAVTERGSKVTIGNDCMFAYDIDLRTGDSHSILNSETMKRMNYAKDIHIGDHVWVAAHVSILKGTTINKNSVVATRSVVTKSFDASNALIGGTPAKILKNDITWDRSMIYES